ncbi:hypothetical protein RCL1_002226 [Eukaryota sp. TZLM3-RCL]
MEKKCLCSTSFFPTCLDVALGYLVAGGQRGELMVYDLQTHRVSYHGSVINTVINAVQIFSTSDNRKAVICASNDMNLAVYMLPSMSVSSTIGFPYPINHASISSCGKMMVSVGDNYAVTLYGSENGRWSKVSTMLCFADIGISTDWEPRSYNFAAASQDGTACVFDARNTKPSAKIDAFRSSSTLDNLHAAFRTVKFSKSSRTDLLTLTQHRSHIVVVDARSYVKKCVIDLGTGVEISGACYDSTDSSLFVSTEDDIWEVPVNLSGRLRECELMFL